MHRKPEDRGVQSVCSGQPQGAEQGTGEWGVDVGTRREWAAHAVIGRGGGRRTAGERGARRGVCWGVGLSGREGAPGGGGRRSRRASWRSQVSRRGHLILIRCSVVSQFCFMEASVNSFLV